MQVYIEKSNYNNHEIRIKITKNKDDLNGTSVIEGGEKTEREMKEEEEETFNQRERVDTCHATKLKQKMNVNSTNRVRTWLIW